jgi:hypothetical protein
VRAITFGTAEDKPQPGDYDGDGKDDIAVFRPSNNVWYVLRTTDWGYHSVEFGATGDIPYRGDYDDDGKTDFAVFRASNGGWYIQRSSGGYTLGQFGQNGDIPVAADYDGDSKPDIAVWRPSNGVWYILRSSDGWVTSRSFGVAILLYRLITTETEGLISRCSNRQTAPGIGSTPAPGIWHSRPSDSEPIVRRQALFCNSLLTC